MNCSVDGCIKKSIRRKMCNPHYRRFMKHGDFLSYQERYEETKIKRFMAKVIESDGCWEWMGPVNKDGYGKYCVHSRKVFAHRFVWESEYGTIPDGLEVCHSCDNPKCVRLDHLFLGTQKENVADMDRKGRRNIKPRVWGESCHLSKFKEKDVLKIRQMYQFGMGISSIAKDFAVKYSAIYPLIKRRTWRYL